MMATGEFAQKLGLVLKATNLSRGRLAQTAGVDKSVVSRWASGVQVPSDHNLSLLTEAVARHRPGFARRDWDLDAESFANRLDTLNAGASNLERSSIAVLPFENMSGDPEQAYFADGLAEDLITGLSRVAWLFVIARNSSFALRGEKLDVRTIGERLGVRYLVEGSVRRAGQRLRLTVQLIEAATGNHLWADRYDGSLADVFDFQDHCVASLVGAIEPKLLAAEIARARRKRPDSLDAFDLFLRALPKIATMSAQGLAEGIELLDRAIGLSPGYAQALAYAAHCRAMRIIIGYSPDSDRVAT
jgi:TolB-like protein